ncbi:MAG: Dabb family protein [Bacteroidaceae bacterium]|nr:Dabb family protein [Bacteroidaceae bacterium]
MVKHIILWRLREDLTAEEKENVKKDIKAGLEGLAGRIPGLLDIRVNVDGRLETSNADVMLDSTFTDEAALRAYAVHPEHVAVADSKVRPYTCLRTCLDYETN